MLLTVLVGLRTAVLVVVRQNSLVLAAVVQTDFAEYDGYCCQQALVQAPVVLVPAEIQTVSEVEAHRSSD